MNIMLTLWYHGVVASVILD